MTKTLYVPFGSEVIIAHERVSDLKILQSFISILRGNVPSSVVDLFAKGLDMGPTVLDSLLVKIMKKIDVDKEGNYMVNLKMDYGDSTLYLSNVHVSGEILCEMLNDDNIAISSYEETE